MSNFQNSMRVSEPTYTQTPNDLFDHWLPHLGEIELKVLLVILRKTFGWHKKDLRDRISLSQLEKLTGSTPSNILKAVSFLVSKGLIEKEVIGPIGKQSTYYQLIVNEDSNNSYPCRNERGTPPDSGVPPLLNQESQNKVPKEKDLKEQQQQRASAKENAAAGSFKKEQDKSKIWDCLNDVDMPIHEKIEISMRYSEDIVKKAIEWATDPKTNIKKGITPAIKWACQNPVKIENKGIPKKQQQQPLFVQEVDEKLVNANKSLFSKLFESLVKKGLTNVFYDPREEYVASQKNFMDRFYFRDSCFIEQISSYMRKLGFTNPALFEFFEEQKKAIFS